MKNVLVLLTLFLFFTACGGGDAHFASVRLVNESGHGITMNVFLGSSGDMTRSINIMPDSDWKSERNRTHHNTTLYPESIFGGDSATVTFDDGKVLKLDSSNWERNPLISDNHEYVEVSDIDFEWVFTFTEEDYNNAGN